MGFYVYLLASPDVDVFVNPFYVGKGTGRRIKDHEWAAKRGNHYNPYLMRKIRAIWRDGGEIQRVKALETEDEQVAFWFEHTLVLLYRQQGVHLTNLTNGGEGASGIVHSPETRKKLSDIMKRIKSTPEERARMSAISKGQSPETRAAQAAKMRATMARPDVKEHLRKVAKEINARPEVQAKRRASLKAAWANPALQSKRIATLKRTLATPESHARKVAASRDIWGRAEYRERFRVAHAAGAAKRRLLSETQQQEVLALFATGRYSAPQLGILFGVSKNTIHKILRRAGVPIHRITPSMKRPALTNEERQTVRRLYATGRYTTRQLGRQFNVGKTTIRRILKEVEQE